MQGKEQGRVPLCLMGWTMGLLLLLVMHKSMELYSLGNGGHLLVGKYKGPLF